MNLARLHPTYISLSARNTFINDVYDEKTSPDTDTFYAYLQESYNDPILQKQSDYVCAVERMEINLNGVPFYDATNFPVVANREAITIRSRINPLLVEDTGIDTNAYSLSHLFEILNSYDFVDPNALDAFKITFSLTKDGFIVMVLGSGKNFTNLEVLIPQRLNQILGISTDVQVAGFDAAQSSFPRVDCGDDLDHIVITSNLPTISDRVGNAKAQVLTDFAPPSNYSNSLSFGADGQLVKSGFSTNLRQKLIYTPTERRWLDLVGDFPLSNIIVEAYYQNQNEELKRIILPYGASFEIKIGFYLRQ